jgi:trans-2,3-dihydro-3-hydroxyanthranilate isomerase
VPLREFRYVVCDVFTDRPLAGNPLAVFTDARSLPEALLQPLARELHLSETVFVYPPSGSGHARLRIFTPAVEIPFAGHPVLGAAFVLAAPLQLPAIVLETGAGPVPVALERDGPRIVFGRMSQPLPTVEAFPAEAALLRALGVARSILPVEAYVNGPRHVYVTLPDEAAVGRLAPDLGGLARLPATTVSCVAGAGRRWKVRVFAPAAGVAEDPATGSAAGPLAWHLARHGAVAFGEEIELHQGAEVGRPSVLYARAEGSRDRLARVEVGGAAVVVARGEFRLDVPA